MIADRWERMDPAFKHAFIILVAMRLGLSLVAGLAWFFFPQYPITYYHGVPPVPPGVADALLGVWQRFDTIWYTRIAMHGYSPGDGTTLFFPLYPALIRLVGGVVFDNYLLAGIIVSNLAFFFALAYLYKLTELESGPQTASHTLIYLSVFPTAFFFLAAYTESLFLLFAVSAFYYARKGRWLPASLMGILAALTKQVGVLLLLPLLYEYLSEREFRLRSIRWSILPLFLIPVGMLAFLLYRHFWIGDSLSIAETYRTTWGVQLCPPWKSVATCWTAIWHPERFPKLGGELGAIFPRRVIYNSFNLACLGMFVLLTLVSFRALRPSYRLYAISLIPTFLLQLFRPPYPLAAVPRYVVVLFPAFMVLGGGVRNRNLRWMIFYLSVMLQAFFTAMFATWRLVA